MTTRTNGSTVSVTWANSGGARGSCCARINGRWLMVRNPFTNPLSSN